MVLHFLHNHEDGSFRIGKNISSDVFSIYTDTDGQTPTCEGSIPSLISDPIFYHATVDKIWVTFPAPDSNATYNGNDANINYRVIRRSATFVGNTGTEYGYDTELYGGPFTAITGFLGRENNGTIINASGINNGIVTLLLNDFEQVVDPCKFYSYFISPGNCIGYNDYSPPTPAETKHTAVDAGYNGIGGSGFAVYDPWLNYEWGLDNRISISGGSSEISIIYTTGTRNCEVINPENGNVGYLADRTGILYYQHNNTIAATTTTFSDIGSGKSKAVFSQNASLTGYWFYGEIRERWVLGGPDYGYGNVNCYNTLPYACKETSYYYNNP